jgi:hypothetical protein
MIDHEFRITELQFPQKIDEMKQTIAQFYAEEGSPQEEIWLVAPPVWRYD